MTVSNFYKTFLLGVIFLAYAGYSDAEDTDPNFALVSAQVKSICQNVANTPVPANDPSSPALAKTLKKCDAADLYYGFNQPADFVKARQCAYATQDYSTLTMIYANGKGAERNWDLAIHFACKAGFAPDEIEGRVLHLTKLRDQHGQGTNFDICDDVTSGYMMGICASHQEALAQKQRQSELGALTALWSATDKEAFLQLQQAANRFFEARSANEVDLSGTGRAEFEIEEKASLQNDFLTALKNYSEGHFPTYKATQIAGADQQLNTVYQSIEKNSDFAVGTIDRAGVKKTQLLWLQYRDAWIKFAKVKYPEVDADIWKTWLTEQRVKMLQDLAAST